MRSSQNQVGSSEIQFSDREQELEDRCTAHLPLVKKLAHQIHSKLPKGAAEFDDLTSAGLHGLVDALKRYEPSRKNSFETFAYTRIRGAILDSLRADDLGSRTLRQKSKRIEQAKDQLTQSFGRQPTEAEIAEYLGMPLQQYRSLVYGIHSINRVSDDFSDKFTENSRDTLLDRIPDSSAVNPLALLEKKETNAQLDRAIASLPEREKRVVSLYYYRDMTMKEIGAELGVMESYVSKIHAKALLKMRVKMRNGGASISSERSRAKHLLLNRGAELMPLKSAQAEHNVYRSIAAMKMVTAR